MAAPPTTAPPPGFAVPGSSSKAIAPAAQQYFEQVASDTQHLPEIAKQLNCLLGTAGSQLAQDRKIGDGLSAKLEQIREMTEGTKKGTEDTVSLLRLILYVSHQQLERANAGKSLLAQQTEKLLSNHAAMTYPALQKEIKRIGGHTMSRQSARYNCIRIMLQLLYYLNEKDGSSEAANQVEEALTWFAKQTALGFLDDSLDYLQIRAILILVSNLDVRYTRGRTVTVEQPLCCGTPEPNPHYGAALRVNETLEGLAGIPICTSQGIYTIPLAAFTTETKTAIQAKLREFGIAVLNSDYSLREMTTCSADEPTLLYTSEEKLRVRGFFNCCGIPLKEKLRHAQLTASFYTDFLNEILRRLIRIALGLDGVTESRSVVIPGSPVSIPSKSPESFAPSMETPLLSQGLQGMEIEGGTEGAPSSQSMEQ